MWRFESVVPGRYAFPRRERMTRRKEYAAVFTEGRKEAGRGFVCYVVRREGQGRKFGCTVSRRVGKAAERNRIKRYVREIYRTHRPSLKQDVHMVLVVRPAAKRMEFPACRDAVLGLFRSGDALNG